MSAHEERLAMKPSQIAKRVAEFLRDGDMEGIISMFHPECQIYFPPTEPPKVGLDGVRATFADFMDLRPTLKSTMTSEVVNGNTALLQADWEILDTDGNVIAAGSSTEVAKKLANGGWGYLIDCPSGPPRVS